ncbi:trypsin-like serine protease [Actinoplanes sp. NPDC049118]|uniref:trypsin-like serine protease n=1 Tax=Actinoplanes sp. NPDC049118 TaxID=3155769 RepID=UPI00340BAB7D
MTAGLACLQVVPAAAALPVEPAALACVATQATEAAATAMAENCGDRVLIDAATSETSQSWALPDGQVQVELSSAPVRARKNNTWVPVDLRLVRQPDGSIAPVAHPDELRLSGAVDVAGVHELAVLGSGSDQVAMGFDGKLPEPELTGSKATYHNVKPNIDLVVEATPKGVESFYVVRKRTAAAQVAKLTMPITGVDATSHKLDKDGALTLLDASNEVVASSPQPLMWDARTDKVTGEPAVQRRVGVTAKHRNATRKTGKRAPIEGAGVDLALTPDMDFLTDPDTVYPVTIDPVVTTTNNDTYDTWVRDGLTTDQTTSTYLQIGAWSGKVARAYLNWNTSAFKGKHISTASLSLWNSASNTCTNQIWEAWTIIGGANTSTRWTNQPEWRYKDDASSATKSGLNGCIAGGRVYMNNMAGFFQRSADAGIDVSHMGLRASDESHPAAAKNFYSADYTDTTKLPQVTVTYDNKPTIGAVSTTPATTCTTGSGRPLIATTTPSLGAVVSDDNSTVGAKFEWWSKGVQVGELTTATTSTSGSVVRAAIPASQELTDGMTYSWRAYGLTADGTVSAAPSNWCEFTVDVTGATTPNLARAFTEPATSLIQDSTGTCATGASRPSINTTTPKLSASYYDIDSTTVSITFEWWTLAGSSSISTVTYSTAVEDTASALVPAGHMTNAASYKWRVKASDGIRVSPWSPWCEFTIDTTAPSISSDTYVSNSTSGSPGLSGTFTFSPAGMSNVAYYKYGLDAAPPANVVNAESAPTGQAQVSIAPATAGKHTLYVQSVDSNGNPSGISAYPFAVAQSDTTDEESAAMKAQERFIQAADKISDVVDTQNPAGYTSIELSDSAVTVWWKGVVPSNVQQAIDDARTIAPVVVNQATYSGTELKARADQLFSEMERDAATNMQTIEIPVEGNKIVVGTSDGAAPRSSAYHIASSSSIPIEVIVANPPSPTAGSGPSTRYNDGWNGTKHSSFAGGGRMYADWKNDIVQCTTGFGVTNGNEEFILTAAHCVYPGQTWKNGNGSRTIGKVSHEWSKMDLALIRTDANRFMWDGGRDEYTDDLKSFTKPVTGWRKAKAGQLVCVSGSLSERASCNWRNRRNLQTRYCTPPNRPDTYSGKKECYSDLILAENKKKSTVKGDSGGPVFTTDGPTVKAVGIVSGGGYEEETGYHLMSYQDFYTANEHWNIRPIT